MCRGVLSSSALGREIWSESFDNDSKVSFIQIYLSFPFPLLKNFVFLCPPRLTKLFASRECLPVYISFNWIEFNKQLMKINKLQLLLLLTYGDWRRKTYIAKVLRWRYTRRFATTIFSRTHALQYCCDIVSNSYNIVPTLQRFVALKVVVANCPV